MSSSYPQALQYPMMISSEGLVFNLATQEGRDLKKTIDNINVPLEFVYLCSKRTVFIPIINH